MVGAPVSKRTHHKQTTLGGVSDIENEVRQKLVTPAPGKQRQGGSWGSLATTLAYLASPGPMRFPISRRFLLR